MYLSLSPPSCSFSPRTDPKDHLLFFSPLLLLSSLTLTSESIIHKGVVESDMCSSGMISASSAENSSWPCRVGVDMSVRDALD
ncbi:hypothetical protein DL95DRAFT_398587, partial [Leptodontidium sp. 2 PMI_412]